MKHLLSVLAIALVCLLSSSARAAETKIYELRIYKTNPGKLEDLLARFRNHTCKIFERHGMENIGYWVPLDDDKGAKDTLIYVIAHKDRDAAKASWAAFRNDPEWKAAQKKSEENGKILAQPPEAIFMDLADFSPAVKLGAGAGERVFELRDYTTPEGKVAPLDARFRDHTCALFEKHGIKNIAYWHPVDADKGAGSRLIYIVAHPSKDAGLASFKKFGADPDWQAARKASEEKAGGSLTVKGGVKSTYLRAVDFSPIR
jgi:heme-degrading monooxygenase HmoA